MSEIVLVVAIADNGVIGKDGAIPWHISDDLKRFKQLTLGKPVLMGRKTAIAIGKPLPGRPNLVLTRGAEAPFAQQRSVPTLRAAADLAGDSELCVIGGGEVYALALPLATHLYLTHVDTQADLADAFFPRFDRSEWRETARVPHAADSRHEFAFTFVDYERLSASR